jgi:NAD(P)-dependent dehydrogenase (short-subunit alcohol dehydrogenase family)
MLRQYFAANLLARRTVFVTGGSGTINFAIARGLGSLGARIVLAGRTPERLEACRDQLESEGTRALAIRCDVQDYAAVEAALVQSEAAFGPVDVLVCGAAANFPAPAEQMTAEGFKKVISTDLLGSFHAARAAFAQLKRTRGNIVFVSATNAIMPFAFQAHVGAAKAGIDSLMRGLALEWGKYGCPGRSRTPKVSAAC